MSRTNEQLKEINQKLDKINQRAAEDRCIKRMEEICHKFPLEKQSSNYGSYSNELSIMGTFFGSLLMLLIGFIYYYIVNDLQESTWYKIDYVDYLIILFVVVLGGFGLAISIFKLIKKLYKIIIIS